MGSIRAEKEEPLARDGLFSKTDVMNFPSSAPTTLLQLLGLRHRRSQRSYQLGNGDGLVALWLLS